MQVLFSNPLIYVIEYPGYGAIELCDRRSGKSGLMTGQVADQFRHEFDDLIAADPELDAFQALIEDYSEIGMHQVVQH